MSILLTLLKPVFEALIQQLLAVFVPKTTITEKIEYVNQDRPSAPSSSVGRLYDRIGRNGVLGR
jgi:hypothetical protein